jgi:hypothetical protein
MIFIRDLGLSGHDGFSGEQLGEDTPGAPQVDRDTVLGSA